MEAHRTLQEDPEKRLKAIEQLEQKHLGQFSMLNELANRTLPGLGDAFSSILESTNRSTRLHKLQLQAESANRKGDHRAAAELYEQALIDLQSMKFSVQRKSAIFAALADTQCKLGEVIIADATFQQAISEAKDEFEIEPNLNSQPEVHCKYALYLIEQQRYEDAKQNIEFAIDAKVNTNNRLIDKGLLKPVHRNSGLSSLKAEYAKILSLAGFHEQAAVVEQEANALKKEDDDRKVR